MKRFIIYILAFLFTINISLTFSSESSASFIIYFDNGKYEVVSNYWEETNQIKFYTCGGLVGVPKDSIIRIKEVDIRMIEEPQSISPSETKKQNTPPHEPPKKENEKEESEDESSLKQKKGDLDIQLQTAREAYQWAKRLNDTRAMDEHYDKIRTILDATKKLKQKLLKKHNDTLPDWWWNSKSE